MRKDVKKILFIGMPSEKEHFFSAAQELGVIHFIDAKGSALKEVPADLERLGKALKILRSLPTKSQEKIHDFSRCDATVDAILECHTALEHSREQQRLLHLEIARVAPFGAFSRADIAYIERMSGRKVHFYWSREDAVVIDELPPQVLWIANQHGLDYFIAFGKEPLQSEHLVEMHIDKPVQELQAHLKHAQREGHRLEERLKDYAHYSKFLHQALIDKLNRYHLATAQSSVQNTMDGLIFATEGWVPEDKISAVQQLTNQLHMHMEEIAADANEIAPTYLENKGPARIGEDLVDIYDTPSNTDKDPSLWVLASFALFFAMIIGDAGYGLIFFAIAFYLRWRYTHMTFTGKRLWQLMLILSGACVLWGCFMTHNFFSIALTPDNPVVKMSGLNWLVEKKVGYHASHNDATFQAWQHRHPQLRPDLDAHTILTTAYTLNPQLQRKYEMFDKVTDEVLFELAIAVGVLHVILSLFRYADRAWVNLAWVVFILGGYLYFPEYLKTISMWQYVAGIDSATAASVGLYMLFIGLAAAVVLSVIKHGFKGVFEVLTATQVFSDVLSYLRLYALGVAGAIMSATVNDMAALLGTVSGILVLLLGHLFNIVLSIQGGIIHGLRLNFLEWYHYSFEGGGKPFRPLEKVQIE